jgi:MFS family permease
LTIKGDGDAKIWWQALTLSTQILDGVGAGTFGTMYILVTSDISGGTGRFGMTLGLTTAAMSIGGTVSGYLGQALAEDYGYLRAFWILCFMSIIPAALYFFCMPETLAQPKDENISMIKEEDDEHPETYSGDVACGEKNYVEMI